MLDFLSAALLSAEYDRALSRALAMAECPVVPFFGAFLRELREILASGPPGLEQQQQQQQSTTTAVGTETGTQTQTQKSAKSDSRSSSTSSAHHRDQQMQQRQVVGETSRRFYRQNLKENVFFFSFKSIEKQSKLLQRMFVLP